MALSYNDLMTRPWTTYEDSGDKANVTGGVVPVRLMAATVMSPAAAGHIEIYDALTVTGTPIMQINSLARDTGIIRFGPAGIRLSTGLTVDATGSIDSYTLFYMLEN